MQNKNSHKMHSGTNGRKVELQPTTTVKPVFKVMPE